jgi:hypothetical protein
MNDIHKQLLIVINTIYTIIKKKGEFILVKYYCDFCGIAMTWEEHKNSIHVFADGEKEICVDCESNYEAFKEELKQKKDELYLDLWKKHFPTIKIEQL